MRELNPQMLKENLEKRMTDDLADCRVGGAALVVRQHGKKIYEGFFGEEKLGSGCAPDHDTIYRLASMTKPITAVAAMILVDRGSISVDDPIKKFLPDYSKLYVGRLDENGNVIPDSLSPDVKIIHLLTHTSGIGTGEIGDKQTCKMTSSDRCTLADAVNYYSSLCIAFEPMTHELYSPVAGLDIMARIIEIVSGKTFDKFLDDEIFSKLGMKNTTFAPSDAQWKKMIYMHNRSDGKNVEIKMPDGCIFGDFPCTYFCGGAGLASTIDDYGIFAEMLLGGGEYNGVRIISQRSLQELSSPHVPVEIQPYGIRWGYGVRVIDCDEYRRLPKTAYGWSGAYGTHFWIDPVNEVTAIYMKNCAYDGGAGSQTGAMFEEDVAASFED